MNPQQQQQQQAANRLHLNFGFQNNPLFGGEAGRAYPTTPSTFPQPFPNSQGQQEVWGAAGQPPQSGFNQQGYFANGPYAPQVPQQQQPSLQPPNSAYRAPPQGYNDATNGMVNQFAHQNLGGANQAQARAQSPYNRQPSPGSRPRTGGAPGGQQQQSQQQSQPQHQSPQSSQQQYGSNFSGAFPQQSNQPSVYDDEPPVKNTERFSTSISNRAKLQTELVSTFFRDSVERARDRNGRAQELDLIVKDPTVSDSRKKAKQEALRKSEVNFLRFLRTSERPQNYQTLKIIGKGAFGEVKLVQRRHDGKIYALKSLVKAEMVCDYPSLVKRLARPKSCSSTSLFLPHITTLSHSLYPLTFHDMCKPTTRQACIY